MHENHARLAHPDAPGRRAFVFVRGVKIDTPPLCRRGAGFGLFLRVSACGETSTRGAFCAVPFRCPREREGGFSCVDPQPLRHVTRIQPDRIKIKLKVFFHFSSTKFLQSMPPAGAQTLGFYVT